jgi:hypothetical protein
MIPGMVEHTPRGARWVAFYALAAATMFASTLLASVMQPMLGKLLIPRLEAPERSSLNLAATVNVTYALGFLVGLIVARTCNLRIQAAIAAILWFMAAACFVAYESAMFQPTEYWKIAYLPLFFVANANLVLLPCWVARVAETQAGQLDFRAQRGMLSESLFLLAIAALAAAFGLLGYPFLIEPNIGLRWQVMGSQIGAGVVLALMIGCAVCFWDIKSASVPGLQSKLLMSERFLRMSRWVLLLALPASLLNATNLYLNVEVSPTPLSLLVFAIIYLLSLVLAFCRIPFGHHFVTGLSVLVQVAGGLTIFWFVFAILDALSYSHVVAYCAALGAAAFFLHSHRWTLVLQPLAALAGVLLFVNPDLLPLEILAVLLPLILWESCWSLHGALAEERPSRPAELFEFLVCIGLGGVLSFLLGMLFSHIFTSAIFEFPVLLVAGCLLRYFPRPEERKGEYK